MSLSHNLKLHGISIDGMSASERQRVEEIGLDAWMDEYSPNPAPRKEFSGRRCALGSDCMQSEKRKAAFVYGGGKYCSDPCRGRASRQKKQEKAVFETENPGMANISV